MGKSTGSAVINSMSFDFASGSHISRALVSHEVTPMPSKVRMGIASQLQRQSLDESVMIGTETESPIQYNT